MANTGPTSQRPVYLRLRDLIAANIMDGVFAEGEMLPSVRAFAAEHGANPLTVAKAFQQFQTDGLIAVRRGVGMYVREGAAAKLRAAERKGFLQDEWPASGSTGWACPRANCWTLPTPDRPWARRALRRTKIHIYHVGALQNRTGFATKAPTLGSSY